MNQKGSHLSRQFPLLIFPHLQWLDCPPVGVIPLIYWSFYAMLSPSTWQSGVLVFYFVLNASYWQHHIYVHVFCAWKVSNPNWKKKTCRMTSPAKELLSNPDLLIIIFNLIILIILTLKYFSFLFPKLVNVFNLSRSAQLFLI